MKDFYADRFFEVLKNQGVELDTIQTILRNQKFPQKAEELSQYDAVVISDCGSNTLLLDPEMQFKGVRKGNRLLAIQDYVKRVVAY